MDFIRFRDSTGATRVGERIGRQIEHGDQTYAIDDVDVLPPSNPEKVIVLDRNQQCMIDMLGFETPSEPRFYIKTPNAVIGQNKTIKIPDVAADVVCEGELAAVVGQQCRDFVGHPDDIIRGYTCVNDLLVRDGFVEDPAAVKGNNFDGSNPVGPVVVPPENIEPTTKITLRINGKQKARSDFSTQLFSLSYILDDITNYLTLERGDIIILGSPMDQFVISEGDTIEVKIEDIGTLKNHVTVRN